MAANTKSENDKSTAEKWSITDKTVLITGANCGVGKATAIELARQGARRIIIGCRDMTKAEQAIVDIESAATHSSFTLTVHKFDLACLDSVNDFAKKVLSTEKVLHVLINNAAILPPSQLELSKAGVEKAFHNNYIGHFLLTNLLLDLLDKSGPSRIVNVASQYLLIWWYCSQGLNIDNINFTDPNISYRWELAYAQSKLANILFTRALHKRLQDINESKHKHHMTTYSLHPGVIASDIMRDYPAIIRFLIPYFFKTPATGAQTSVYLATEPEIEHLSSRYFINKAEKDPGDFATDDHTAEKLWEWTENFLKSRGIDF